jgi:hypothetical protein
MNPWIWLLIALLVLLPKNAAERSGRIDVRAMALLFCVLSLVFHL